jgi:hypothetical protein
MRVYSHVLEKIPLFQKCLESGFRESQEKVIRMPEDVPEEVEQLLTFAFLTVYNQSSEHQLFEVDPTEQELHEHERMIIKLYVLAYKAGFEEFQNFLVDELRKCCAGRFFSVQLFQVLEQAGLENSKMFSYMITQTRFDVAHLSWNDLNPMSVCNRWLPSGGRSVPELLKKFLRGTDEPDNPSTVDYGCRWHVHKSTPTCVKTKNYEEDTALLELCEDDQGAET